MLSELAAIAGACKAEAPRLSTRAARADAAAERLRSYILDVMQTSGIRKLEGTTDGFRAQANPPAVLIDDVAALPEDYVRYIQRTEPDRQIARQLKAGGAVPGCRLKQTMRLVRT